MINPFSQSHTAKVLALAALVLTGCVDNDYDLTKDIDMSMLSNFTPIGLYSDYGEKHVFEGTFDGRGHIISV